MRKKLFTIGLILSVIAIIFVYFKFYYYPIINPLKNSELMPRFNLKLQNNYYYVTKYYIEIKDDKSFEKESKKVYLKNKTIKYGVYLFTESGGEYVFGKIDNEYAWIKYSVPISEKYKNFIKKLSVAREYKEICRKAEVTPFNDQRFVLINLWYASYIVDLEKEKIVWSGEGYYEAPQINFKTDCLECGGDSSGKTYVFNKFGKLIKTIGFW